MNTNLKSKSFKMPATIFMNKELPHFNMFLNVSSSTPKLLYVKLLLYFACTHTSRPHALKPFSNLSDVMAYVPKSPMPNSSPACSKVSYNLAVSSALWYNSQPSSPGGINCALDGQTLMNKTKPNRRIQLLAPPANSRPPPSRT